jgi:hypothetical protein
MERNHMHSNSDDDISVNLSPSVRLSNALQIIYQSDMLSKFHLVETLVMTVAHVVASVYIG